MSSFGKYFEPARTAIRNWLWPPSSAAQYQWRHRVGDRVFLALAKRKIGRESGKRPLYLVLRPRSAAAGVMRTSDGRPYRWFPVLKNGYSSVTHMLIALHGVGERYRGFPKHASSERDANYKVKRCKICVLGRTEQVQYPRPMPTLFVRAKSFSASPRADIRFCILRHPLDRFVSVYRNHMIRAKLESGGRPYRTLLSPDVFCAEIEKDWHRRPWMPGIENRGRTDGVYAWDKHLWPQHFFLGRDASYFTHIFSFVDLSPLSEFLSDLHCQRMKLPHGNRSGGLPMPHLSASLRRRVEALYKEDFEIFGRHMPPPQI